MAAKPPGMKRGGFARSLSVSLAGARVGGAFAIDGLLQKLKSQDKPAPTAFARREARHFVAELGRLKGTYVKIGQMLALLGEHFLPPVLTEALHALESQTEPLTWSDIKPLLRESLGDKFGELRIERKAIAAASLAQVHRATVIASGEQICLKIQYPGLAEVIDKDFDTVVSMLLLARWIKAGRELDDWLEAMRVQLHYEIDYLREAAMASRMSDYIAQGQPGTQADEKQECDGACEQASNGLDHDLDFILMTVMEFVLPDTPSRSPFVRSAKSSCATSSFSSSVSKMF